MPIRLAISLPSDRELLMERVLTEYDSRGSRDAVVAAGVEIDAGESLDQAERLLAELQAIRRMV